MNSKNPIAISLFSGMGGLDLGLKKAGYKIAVQLDIDHHCIETLKTNWPRVPKIQEDIAFLTARKILSKANLSKRKVDLIAGGPSCQPFSRSNEGKRKGVKDRRGKLIFEFARLVDEIRPKAFIMENVAGLISSNKGKDFKKLLNFYNKINYHIQYQVLNAAEYGLPQKRKRLFLVGFRKKTNFNFPNPTHGEGDGLAPFVTSGEVLRDLDDGIIHDSTVSIGGKHGHLINDIPPGMNYIYYTAEYNPKNAIFRNRSKFWTFLLKLDPKQPSTTIQASPWSHVGPFHWNNRRLTIAEIKRLQGIPDNYFVSGAREKEYTSPAWRQIGDAVPPLLSYVLGKEIKKIIY